MQVCRVETSTSLSLPGNAAAFSGSKALSRFRGYEWVSIAFAIVLLFAAVLKGRLLLSWEAQLLSPGQRAIDAAAALIEFLLAIWILSGLARFWAWIASLVLVGVFVAVAGYRMAHGASDCGCLGQVTVRPGIMLLFDAVIATALLRWRPDTREAFGARWRRGIALSAGCLCFSVLGIMAQPVQTGVVATPAVYDLGTVQPRPLIHKITLTNRTSHLVNLNRVIAGCGCTTVKLPAKQLGPGESAIAACEIDFTGRSGEFGTFVQFMCQEDGVRSTERVVRCMIRADVDSVLRLDASELTFACDEPASCRVQLRSKQPDVRITNVQFTHDAFRAKVTDDLAFHVIFNPALWHDSQGRVRMFVDTTCETQRRIIVTIPVTASAAK